MNGDSPASDRDEASSAAATRVPLRPYSSPAILPLGDIRDLTLGGSPGRGDSGGGVNFKCRGCP